MFGLISLDRLLGLWQTRCARIVRVELYVGILFVKVFVEKSISSLCTAVNVSST